ncbi:AsmA family protein [Pseudorhodoplanes sp.]|uniref:AsmA family protein n=1 Tax=Pseudorhodoplanes sp. TaxID=1934341 RepID=UPI002B636AF9|nr:AsmA family protein [Pseudorhodoplanes sp.]HWV43296.1 AsmA family protein [Pseudorhodoplanes sp.]
MTLSAVTGFKRLALAVGALILCVFGALAVVSFLVPKDQVREAVKSEIRAATGLDPQLRGDVSVSLFPYGQVTLTDVALGDDNGEPPLQAAQLVARLSFLPLLMGRIDIADITLAAPRIVVSVDETGTSNWRLLLRSLERAAEPEAPSFSEIRIKNGMLVVRDAHRNIYEYVSDADLSLAWPAISRSFAVTGSVRYRGETLEIGATVANFAAALHGERSALKLRVAGAPLKFTFDGAMATRPTLKIEGATSADAPSLRNALVWLGKKPLPGGGFERLALKAQTNLIGGTLALSQVNLELDGNVAEGVLTFAADGRQTLQGTLAVDQLDLTPYLSTVRLLASTEREWNRAPIDLDGLATTDFDLRLSAGNATIGSTSLGRTAIATNLRAGKLTVTIGESRGFGGVIRGSIGLARSEQGATFTSQLQFDNINLERCISELFGLKRIEGKGSLAVSLEGSGPSVYAITRTLDGEATLTATKGALTGLNVEQLLRRLERRPLSSGSEYRSGRTPFETLSVQMKIAKGNVTVDSVDLRSPAVKLAMAGEASIPARDLDLKGTATLVAASANAKPFELPFAVQGQWDDPLLLPDAQILIQRSGAAAPLLESLRSRRDAARTAPNAPSEQAPAPALKLNPSSDAATPAATPTGSTAPRREATTVQDTESTAPVGAGGPPEHEAAPAVAPSAEPSAAAPAKAE